MRSSIDGHSVSGFGIVHEVELQVSDIVADLPPVFKAFYDSEEARTCPNCGTVHPGK